MADRSDLAAEVVYASNVIAQRGLHYLPRTSDPSSPDIGDTWYRSDSDELGVYTQSSGVVKIPTYSPGTPSNEWVVGVVGVGRRSIAFVDPNNKTPDYPWLQRGFSSGTLAAHGSTSGSGSAIFSDGFEDGSVGDTWTVYSDSGGNVVTADTNYTYSGSYSAYAADANDSSRSYLMKQDIFSTAKQPSAFEFYYREDDTNFAHNGAGMRIVNSNGNYECGLTTNSPQWVVSDANGTNEIYSGDGDQRWVYARIENIDWSNNTFDVYWEDKKSGTVVTKTGRPLRKGVDMKTIRVESYNAKWSADTADVHQWFDDVSVES